MSEHTPTPWAEDPDDREGMEWNIHIVRADDRDMRVCFMTSGPEAGPNAAFIVKAVNAHDDLVAALTLARAYVVNTIHLSEDLARIDAALAKVQP